MKKRVVVIILSLFLMPIVSLGILTATDSLYTKPLPTYGEVPDFNFESSQGKMVSRSELYRKVWVAGFVFTNCAGTCPLIMGTMMEIEKTFLFKENFRMVALTMDPERDTPKVLRDYAAQSKADPYKFLFLTGDKRDIQNFVQNGFRLSAAEDKEEGDITHSGKLVLVDGYGKIRGYYDREESGTMKRIKKDIKRLLRETTY